MKAVPSDPEADDTVFTGLASEDCWAYERGMGSQRQVAKFFGVSLAFVEKLFAQIRSTGSLAPKPHAGGKPSRLGEPVQQDLRHWLQEQSNLTLAERAGHLETAHGIPRRPAATVPTTPEAGLAA